MNSEEFGLVAAQQLLQCEDLHYGYWDKNLPLQLSNLAIAQEKHTHVLLEAITKYSPPEARLLDVGCGIGTVMKRLLKADFNVDGLVPSVWMAKKAEENIATLTQANNSTIYCQAFQHFNTSQLTRLYDVVFFSESYQYIELSQGFSKLKEVLAPNGTVIIFDFFRKDDVEGQSPLGGGHSMEAFYRLLKAHQFMVVEDQDLTTYLSPNLKLISELLGQRILPFGHTLDTFLSSQYKIPYAIIKFFLRKQLAEFRFKYSQQRNQANFEKYKSYRLISLKHA